MAIAWEPDVPASVIARNNQAIATATATRNANRAQELRDSIALKKARAAECTRELERGYKKFLDGYSAVPRTAQVGDEFTYEYYLSWIKAAYGNQNPNIRAGTNGLVILSRSRVLNIRSGLLSEVHNEEKELATLGATTSGTGTAAAIPATPPTSYSSTVIYNVSSVKEAYFYTGMSFVNKADADWSGAGATDKFDNIIWSGNTPGKVDDANQLWATSVSSNSKGMIQTWNPPGGRGGFINPTDSNFTTLATSSSVQRYGFQFLYNPTTIDMSYGGVADVDPGLQSSGNEEFLLANPSVFKSTINLQIVINRMFDFQYINQDGIKSGQISDFYAGNVPTTGDLTRIYERGTMYDVEFLLQTMFPYEPIESQLRGKTSDIGFLGASPVELHLGNKLRYVAQINNISVNHVIFDNRMVPLFTTISVSTNRIPDYRAPAA
jgi:hypothetical protein